MKHRFLSSAMNAIMGAAAVDDAPVAVAGAPAATTTTLVVPPAAAGATAALVTPPAPAAVAAGADDEVDVVTLADAQAAAKASEDKGKIAGATEERKRFAAVLGSDAGKLHASSALFMLEHNPTASAESINAHLAAMPKPAAAAAPAAAITTPLNQTPAVVIAPNASAGGGNDAAADTTAAEQAWKDSIDRASASLGMTPRVATNGVRPTGN